MVSEELLLEVEGIDPETTFEELIEIVDKYVTEHGSEEAGRPTHIQWENLADAAFLAAYHDKPKSFKRIVEMAGRILAVLDDIKKDKDEDYPDFSPIEEAARALCLISTDAPQDPQVVSYMLGHLKGALRACRVRFNSCDAQEQQKIRQGFRFFPQGAVHS